MASFHVAAAYLYDGGRGCAGSTAGGVKNVRLLLLLRNVKNEFHRLMHPRAVLPVKMNRMAVSQRTLATVMTFVFFILSVSFMLAGADVHGHRTGRIFRTICIKYR